MSFADEIWENSYIKPNENGNGTRIHVFDADGVGVWKNGRCELIWDKMLWDTRAMDCGVWWSIRSLNLQQVLRTITSIVNCVSIGLHELTLSNKSRSILNQDPKTHSIAPLETCVFSSLCSIAYNQKREYFVSFTIFGRFRWVNSIYIWRTGRPLHVTL